jgi:hypothetical protein
LNAFLNFYNDEKRHMFRDDGAVSRTYHIWLPSGQPVIAGYAIEACWEPPSTTPVKDPLSDFPISANQDEAYKFYVNINNGQPITDPARCVGDDFDGSNSYFYSKQWGPSTAHHFAVFNDGPKQTGTSLPPCGDKWPDCYCGEVFFCSKDQGNGDYLGVAVNFEFSSYLPPPSFAAEHAYTVFEYKLDIH